MKNPLKQLNAFIKKKVQKRIEKKLAENNAKNEMWQLIHEYGLVKQGKSTLSASKRKAVLKYMDEAIESGAIKSILK
jgi:hypothetical protein